MIETPRGTIVVGPNGKAELKWKTSLAPKWTRRYSRAQKFVDSEVLRRCEPYVPLLTGTLIKSGILGTEVGSGMVAWITPYAKRQYYAGRRPGASKTGSLRGRLWFPRMKEVHGSKIVAGAKKLMGEA